METVQTSSERVVRVSSGWLMLAISLALPFAALFAANALGANHATVILPGILAAIVAIILLACLFSLQPNEARVLILFGAYKGTVRESGFWWGNPLFAHTRAVVTVHPLTVTTVKTAHGKEQN